MDEVFTKAHLQKALDRAKLPSDYTTILKYERKGIIPLPQKRIRYGKRFWRSYSQEEIDNIVALIRAYKGGQTSKGG